MQKNHDIENKPEDVVVEEAVDKVIAEVDAANEWVLERSRSTGTPTPRRGHGGAERVLPTIRKDNGSKLGRNDKCPCDSGLKFKKCCWDVANG